MANFHEITIDGEPESKITINLDEVSSVEGDTDQMVITMRNGDKFYPTAASAKVLALIIKRR